MTAWLDNARSLLVLSCSKAVRKNRNWTAARTDVVRLGEAFYKDGTASCGLTLERSDEEARLSHDAKRGRSRSCVSWLSFPGRRTALGVHCSAAGQSADPDHERPPPCCSIKNDRR